MKYAVYVAGYFDGRADVMFDELECGGISQMRDVFALPRNEIIQARDLVALLNETIAEV